jgi:hypothetical protein
MSWRDLVIELLDASDVCTRFTLSTPQVQVRVADGETNYQSEVYGVKQKKLILNKRLVFQSPTAPRVRFSLFQVFNLATPELVGLAEVELAALIRGFEGDITLNDTKNRPVAKYRVKMFFMKPQAEPYAPRPFIVRQNQRSNLTVADSEPASAPEPEQPSLEAQPPVVEAEVPPRPLQEPEIHKAPARVESGTNTIEETPADEILIREDKAVGKELEVADFACQTETNSSEETDSTAAYQEVGTTRLKKPTKVGNCRRKKV